MARPSSADASGLGALGVLAATVPAMVLGTEINEAVCGDRQGGTALAKLSSGLSADPEVSLVTPPGTSPDGAVALLTVVPKHSPQDAEVTDVTFVDRWRRLFGV